MLAALVRDGERLAFLSVGVGLVQLVRPVQAFHQLLHLRVAKVSRHVQFCVGQVLAQLTERHGVRFVTVLLVVDDEVVVLGRRRINRLAIKPTRTQLCQPLTQQRRCELFRQRFLLQCLVWVDAVALQHARQQLVVVDADA